jgi:hypothetical protein
MIDLVKTLARYFSGDHGVSTNTMMSGGCIPWEERTGPQILDKKSLNQGTHYGTTQRAPGRVTNAESRKQSTKNQQLESRPPKQALYRSANEITQQYDDPNIQDRLRMPPPPPIRHLDPRHIAIGTHYNVETDAQSMATKRSRGIGSYDLSEDEFQKRKREHAAAFRLQPKPGFWYKSEHGLYYHLWMRGYEELVPISWAPDFKTYPTQLFDKDVEAASLIASIELPEHHSTRAARQFRAIHALRELAETGHKVRDQKLAKFKIARIQGTIKRQIEEYVDWALSDADLYPTRQTLPTHHVAQRAQNQSVAEAISDLASVMHASLGQHRGDFADDEPLAMSSGLPELKRESLSMSPALPSFPTEDLDPDCTIRDDSQGNFSPVIVGFLIVGTTVTIFTLNAQNADAEAGGDKTYGIHMLGRFNFNEPHHDVWNALAIAIAACHVRNALLAAARPFSCGPDARLTHGAVAGYVNKEQHEAEKKKRKREMLGDDSDEEIYDGKGKGKKPVRQNGRRKRRAIVAEDSDPDL